MPNTHDRPISGRLEFVQNSPPTRGRVDLSLSNTIRGYPLPSQINCARVNNMVVSRKIALSVLVGVLVAGCSSNPLESTFNAAPATIPAATAAPSPPETTVPAGRILPFEGTPESVLFDQATSSLAILRHGPDPQSASTVTVIAPSGAQHTVVLPGPAPTLSGNSKGIAYLPTQGGYFTVDLSASKAAEVSIPNQADTMFTAIGVRADGRLVLGTADGAVYTLTADGAVGKKTDRIFSRVDALSTVGNDAVVLDRGQTLVTALDSDGTPQQALRAGEGATSMTADQQGRILITDTRGGQLLVFGVDPLIERQAYPVSSSPFGLAGSSTLAWVSQTAANAVVGYDLSTGIPVEKVRYPTVQQPNSLAFDDKSGTLYVVSGSGAGVQVIPHAAGGK